MCYLLQYYIANFDWLILFSRIFLFEIFFKLSLQMTKTSFLKLWMLIFTFQKKSFILHELFHQNTSKFAIFNLVYKNLNFLNPFIISCLYFSPSEFPGLWKKGVKVAWNEKWGYVTFGFYLISKICPILKPLNGAFDYV